MKYSCVQLLHHTISDNQAEGREEQHEILYSNVQLPHHTISDNQAEGREEQHELLYPSCVQLLHNTISDNQAEDHEGKHDRKEKLELNATASNTPCEVALIDPFAI